MAPPIGLAELPQFAETSIALAEGDSFLLYTDGLFGFNDKKRRLTPESLGQFIHNSAQSAQAILGGVLDASPPADGTNQLPDDVAAIAVLRTS
jgi:serine phosphatase RsbU (regulator of sigma subunit)